MHMLNPSHHPHRRYNPLTDEWILVSPHRALRPWKGKVESLPSEERPHYDAACYLCPGNGRAGGARNPNYAETFVFDNDFGALLPGTPADEFADGGLLLARGERGVCRVVCFSPRHDMTLAEMEREQIVNIVNVWADEYASLAQQRQIGYVQIFENKGELMGCSNPHPHGQIWASGSVPAEPAREGRQLQAYLAEKGHCLLCDYRVLEEDRGERIVCANEAFVALVPFWAVWPFETMVLPRRHLQDLNAMSDDEKTLLADILRRVTVRYDNVFHVSFPYSSGIHQAPTTGGPYPEWHLHMHFYPPLLRSATVKKFMVGYEMLANPQRDVTAEVSAATLREQPEVHYKHRTEGGA